MRKQQLVMDNTAGRKVKPVSFLRYKNNRGKWQLVYGFSDGALYWPSEEFDMDTDATTAGVLALEAGITLP